MPRNQTREATISGLRLVRFPDRRRSASGAGAVEQVLPGWDLCSPEFQAAIRDVVKAATEPKRRLTSQPPRNINKPVIDLAADHREGA